MTKLGDLLNGKFVETASLFRQLKQLQEYDQFEDF